MYEPAWTRSLQELGVNCELVDTFEYIPKNAFGRLQHRLLYGPSIFNARERVLERISDTKPDVVLLYQGHIFDADFLTEAKTISFVAGYHNDDPFGPKKSMLRYRLLKTSIPFYDSYHFYRKQNTIEARDMGLERTGVVMPGYIPWMDYPRKSPSIHAAYDGLFFAGHCEDDLRVACFESALNKGVPIRIYGDARSWREHSTPHLLKAIHPVRHIFGDDYRSAITNSAISLCFFSKKNRDHYTRRVFEITACGGFLLCERTNEMQDFFREGEEAEYFDGAEEFLDKAIYYLRNENTRHAIALRGYERAISSGYDVVSRTKGWLSDVSNWIG